MNRLTGLIILLMFAASMRDVWGWTGPSQTLPPPFSGTLQWDGNQSLGLSEDGAMGTGARKTVFISYNQPASQTATVYWGPGIGNPISISLDDMFYGGSENLTLSPNGAGATVFANGYAEWRGYTYISRWNGSWYDSSYTQVRFTMQVYSNKDGTAIQPLVSASSVGIDASAGAVFKVTPGVTYRVRLGFDVYALDGTWQPALDYFNNQHSPTSGLSGRATKYTFNYGFYYDRAPTALGLSSYQISENNAINAVVGQFTVNDNDSSGAYTYTLTSGAGSDDNGSFNISGSSLRASRSFDYEAKSPSQYSVLVRATDSAGNIFDKSLSIVVLNVNEPPRNTTAMPGVTLQEDFSPAQTVNLSSYFADVDSDLTYSVTVDNANLVNATVSKNILTLSPKKDANGSSTVRVTASDGQYTASAPFAINITPVNDAPVVSAAIPAQTVDEDFVSYFLQLNSYFSDVDGDKLTYTAALYQTGTKQPSSLLTLSTDSSGRLVFNPKKDENGTADITIQASDGKLSASTTFRIQINAVNDRPYFTAGVNPSILEDSGPYVASNWATGISPGATNEFSQSLNFLVTGNSNPNLFSTAPSVGSDGKLSFTPAANANGTATIRLQLKDNGGTDRSGLDTSASTDFVITVQPVNDPPSFSSIPETTVNGQPDPNSSSNELIKQLDYSDSFTINSVRTDGLYNNNSRGGYGIESAYGNPSVTWAPIGNFSFNTHGSSTDPVRLRAASGNIGAAGGFAQTGGSDFAIPYGLRSSYVVQVDAILRTDRIDINSLPSADSSIFGASRLSVFFRRTGFSNSEIGLYNGSVETALSVPSGVNDDNWHNYAVHFDRTINRLGIYIDGILKTNLDLTTFAGGIYKDYSNGAVGIGGNGGAGWLDNFRVGSPTQDQKLTISGITVGPNEPSQGISSIFAETTASDVPGLISSTKVTYTSGTNATLNISLGGYKSGDATIRVTIKDNGGTQNGGIDTYSQTFKLKVLPVDHPPIITGAAPRTIVFDEDQPSPSVSLNGAFLDLDGDLFQTLSASSSNLDRVRVTTSKPSTDTNGILGSMEFTLSPDFYTTVPATSGGNGANSPILITVIASANGKAVTNNIPLTVREVNDPPTLDVIPDQIIDEDGDVNIIPLSGISPGPNETGIDFISTNQFAFESSNTNLIAGNRIWVTDLNMSAGTAKLNYSTIPLQSGTGQIIVTLHDSRGGKTTRTFNVKVNHINHAPFLAQPLPEPFLSNASGNSQRARFRYFEDSQPAIIDLSKLFMDIDGDSVSKFIAANTNSSLLRAIASGDGGNNLQFTLTPHAYGSTELTVRASDGFLSSNYVFQVDVQPINDPPNVDPIPDRKVPEDSGPHQIPVSGIDPGPANEQGQAIVSVRAEILSQTDTNLISSIQVSYSTNTKSGVLTFDTGTDMNGEATIRIIVQDNGGTENGGLDSTIRDFRVVVIPSNDPPALVKPFGSIVLLEDALVNVDGRTNLNLAGVFLEKNHPGQPVTVLLDRINDPADILADESNQVKIDQVNPETLMLSIKPEAFGTAAIPVRGLSEGLRSLTADTVTVVVQPVNDPPSFAFIPDQDVNEDGGPFTIQLTGISTGPTNEFSQRIISGRADVISSSVQGLITNLSVTLGTNNTARLVYGLGPNLVGSAKVRVTIQDSGGTDNGGLDSFSREFVVQVSGLDDTPTLSRPIPEFVFLEDQFASSANQHTIDLSGYYTEPDSLSLQLVLGAIQDPNDILNNELGNVRVNPQHPEQIQVEFKPNAFGTARIPINAIANGLVSPNPTNLVITVMPVNDPPTLDAVQNYRLTTGSGAQRITITSIRPGPKEDTTQKVVSVTASVLESSAPGLFAQVPIVEYKTNELTATLTYTLAPQQTGHAKVRISVQDDGGTDNGGVNSVDEDFLISVDPVDNPPVLAAPKGKIEFREEMLNQGTNLTQVVDFRNVFSDDNNAQIQLLVERVDDFSGILDDRAVRADTTDPQFLVLPFLPNQWGTAVITYRAVANRQVSVDADQVVVVVHPFDNVPTLDPIFLQLVNVNSGPHTLSLTGISPGVEESDEQRLSVTAQVISQTPDGLINSINVDHEGTNSTGTLTYSLGKDKSGQASVRVTVADAGGKSSFREFRIRVASGDGAPVLAQPMPDLTFLEDQFAAAANRTAIDLSKVFIDPENQTVIPVLKEIVDASDILAEEQGLVFVNSSNQTLLVSFRPDQSGDAQISFAGLAHGVFSQSNDVFTIRVKPVNDAPTLNPIPNQRVIENSGLQTVPLAGLSVGPMNESSQVITSVTATITSQTLDGLIDGPIAFTPGTNSSTGSLQYRLGANKSGSATIRVQLADNGGLDDGGVNVGFADFLVEVADIDQPPRLVAGMGQLTRSFTPKDFGTDTNAIVVDLTGVFVDDDGDALQVVTDSILDQDDILDDETPGMIGLTSTNKQALRLKFKPDAFGSAQITFRVVARGQFSAVSARLIVNMTPDLGAPSFQLISDQTIVEDSGLNTVIVGRIKPGVSTTGSAARITSLAAVVVSSDPPNLFDTVRMVYTNNLPTGRLEVIPAAGMDGTAQLRVTLTDDGVPSATRTNAFSRTFTVRVVSADDLPRLSSNLYPDQQFQEDQFAESNYRTTLDLNGLFVDPENDPISLLLREVSDPNDILEEESGNVLVDPFNQEQLSVKFRPNAFGTARLRVGATAAGLTSTESYSFNITVIPVNDPPVFDSISPQVITQNSSLISLPVSGIRVGPANEASQRILSMNAVVDSQSGSNLVQGLNLAYSGGTNATLQFRISTNYNSGNAVIRISAKDDGGVANGGIDTFERQFALSVNVAKLPPALAQPKGSLSYFEDQFAGQNNRTAVDLAGVFTNSDGQPIQIIVGAISDPADVLDDESGAISIDPSRPQSLRLAFKPNAFGSAQISYRAQSGGLLSVQSDTVTISVTPVNDAPTFAAISSQTVEQGTESQTVLIRSIGVGPLESSVQKVQSLQAQIVLQTPSDLLAGTPIVSLTNNSPTASLTYRLNPARFGQARIRVSLVDDGGVANGGTNTFSREFDVRVTPVDHPPVLATTIPTNALAKSFLEDQFASAGNKTSIDLTGLFVDPDGDAVVLSLGAIADPDDVLDNEGGQVRIDNINPQLLNVGFRKDGFGVARIPIGASANNRAATNLYELVITVQGVNDAPAFNAVQNVSLLQGAVRGTNLVSGINSGLREAGLQNVVSVQAQIVSENPTDLISGNVNVFYTNNASVAVLTYALNTNQSGSATIRLTVSDDGGTANGGVNSTSRDFQITVNPVVVDHLPELVSPKGAVNFVKADIDRATNRQVQLNLQGVFQDVDGDSISLFLASITDTNNILDDETVGNIRFDAQNPQQLLLTFRTNAIGAAQISYFAVANGQISTVADTVTISVSLNSAQPNSLPASTIVSTVRPMILGTPSVGNTLRIALKGRVGLGEGQQAQWEIADNDLGSNLRPLVGATGESLVLSSDLEGRYLRVSVSDDGKGTLSSELVHVGRKLVSLKTWRTVRLGTDTESGFAADFADPDNDGIVNLAEFALGLDPLYPDLEVARPRIENRGSESFMIWDIAISRTRAAEVSMSLDQSLDLKSWSDAGSLVEIADETKEMRHHQVRVPMNRPQVFFRWRLSR